MFSRNRIFIGWGMLICLTSRTVSGTVMELIPNPFILGQNGTLAMNCYLDGLERNTRIRGLKTAIILRNSTRENGLDNPVVIAETYYGNDPTTGNPITVAGLGSASDVTSRDPTVSGDLKTSWGSEQTAEVSLRWDARGIVCEDMGDYHCQVKYTDFSSQDQEWTTTSVMRPLSYPANLQMTVREPNSIPGFPSQSRGGETANNPLEFKEGEVVQMECEGSVGNDRNRRIKWYRTRDFQDDVDETIQYNEGVQDTVPDEMENCHYQRKSTVDYNVTVFDVQRTGPIQFFCQIEYSTQNGQSMTLTSNRRVFILAGGGVRPTSPRPTDPSSSPRPTDPSSSPRPTDAASEDRFYVGVIVGGIAVGVVVSVAVAVVAVIYWRRKESQAASSSSAKASVNAVNVSNAIGMSNIQPSISTDSNDQVPAANSAYASATDVHVYDAIDSSKVQPSIYTGLEMDADGYEIPVPKTQPQPKYENLF